MNARLLAITTIVPRVISGCGYNLERDKDCSGCDMGGAELLDADLTNADLAGVTVPRANLIGANLDGVKYADFTGAKNVPEKYLKRWRLGGFSA